MFSIFVCFVKFGPVIIDLFIKIRAHAHFTIDCKMDDIQKVQLEYEDFFPLLHNQAIFCPDNRERFLFTKKSENPPMCCHAPDYFDEGFLSLNKVQFPRIIATFCFVVSKYCLKLFLTLESFHFHLYFVSFDNSSQFWLFQI